MVIEAGSAEDAIVNLLRLLGVLRRVEPAEQDEIGRVADFLRALIGPTVRPAQAARLLGVSHPALKRWVDLGEISSVLTPEGRYGIPLPGLLGLLVEVEAAREAGSARPLARVIRNRKHVAASDTDLVWPLPRASPQGHRVAELHSLAYHRAVARRLDGPVVREARRRIERWRAAGRIHPTWADRWGKVLEMPVEQMARAISSDSRAARSLRQTSPFAGVLNEQERRRLVETVDRHART
jgi:hypothetical protein